MKKNKKLEWENLQIPPHWTDSYLEQYPDPNVLVEILKEVNVVIFEAGFELTEKPRMNNLWDPFFVVPLHEALYIAEMNGWEIYEGYAVRAWD